MEHKSSLPNIAKEVSVCFKSTSVNYFPKRILPFIIDEAHISQGEKQVGRGPKCLLGKKMFLSKNASEDGGGN
jgi:hypothetical protein